MHGASRTIDPSTSREVRDPLWQRAIVLLSGTVVGLVLVIVLIWGRPVLVPIALAGLLTFLLNPVVRFLSRRGVPHIGAVLLAVSITGGVLAAIGTVVTRQVAGVLAEIPQNTANIRAKVKSLRQLGTGPLVESFVRMVDEVGQEFSSPARNPADRPDRVNVGPRADLERSGWNPESTRWSGLTGVVGSFLEIVATLAFALVLLVFFLLGRDDLRDRIVMLAGGSRLALTSKAVEDIAQRIGRYVAIVGLLNGGFGLVMTAGLLALQVPYALLWGFLAGTLRFIPYIGPWIGAVFPILMSLAAFEGWWTPAMVVGFVLVLELVSNNIAEPLLFGQNTGVSPTALLISAAFWLFLWGPVGLVLSAPFAVCLVVVGKNIPELRFLHLLLGDAPALRAHVGLYQRLMLGDVAEATAMVLDRARSGSMVVVCDELLVPALNCLRRDVRRGHLTSVDEEGVLAGIESVLRRTAEIPRVVIAAENATNIESPDTTPPDETESDDTVSDSSRLFAKVRLLGCPALDDTDRLGLEMLRQNLDPDVWDWECTTVDTLASELAARMATDRPDVVCIGAVPPGGLGHARYLCKRLHDAAPELTIIVGRWGHAQEATLELERLEAAGAGFVSSTIADTLRILESRRLLAPALV
jgi:predicted PurR-regulated permease PerM